MGSTKVTAALLVVHDFTAIDRVEFESWCDEQMPERLRLPGFVSAQRWYAAGQPNTSVVLYDLESLGALNTPEYTALCRDGASMRPRRIVDRCDSSRYYAAEQLLPGTVASPAEAGALYMIAMNVEEPSDAEFNAWYDEEHWPRLSAVDGVVCARRYRSVEGPHRYFAIYHLEDAGVVGSPPWLEAAETPWTHRMRQRMSDRSKLVCQHVVGVATADADRGAP